MLIRADASTRIGTGHVMRMLALAQAWKRRGGVSRFVCCECPESLKQRIEKEGFSFHGIRAAPGSSTDLTCVLEILGRENNRVVALDGYHFDVEYQRRVRDSAGRVLVLDDFGHLGEYCCDILLNQNPTAKDLSLRARASGAIVLEGPSYALIREEYLRYPRHKLLPDNGPLNLLVTLGGSDPDNITGALLRALGGLERQIACLHVLVGAANPYQDQLLSHLQRLPFPAELLANVSDMPAELAWADAAICAGGSTCWEMGYMGIPVAVVTLAENQRAIGAALEAMGAAVLLGWHEEISRTSPAPGISRFLCDTFLRERISKKLHSLVDGRGASRVVANILATDVILSPATKEDSRRVWELANDSTVRQASFLSDPIPWEKHMAWYVSKLSEPDARILIASDDTSRFLGVIRFEPEATATRISVAVDPAARGRGIGAAMIIRSCQWMFDNSCATQILAYIRPENKASCSAFLNAGFKFHSDVVSHNQNAFRYVLEKPDASRD